MRIFIIYGLTAPRLSPLATTDYTLEAARWPKNRLLSLQTAQWLVWHTLNKSDESDNNRRGRTNETNHDQEKWFFDRFLLEKL